MDKEAARRMAMKKNNKYTHRQPRQAPMVLPGFCCWWVYLPPLAPPLGEASA